MAHRKLISFCSQNPARFIQVLASFSLLSPERLGFDPTIKLLVSPNYAVPSYMPNEDFIKAYEAPEIDGEMFE